MPKSVEICQFVTRAINYTTWNIPRIRDGDMWRNIENVHFVENPHHINGHDHYEDAIFRAEQIMEQRGFGLTRFRITNSRATSTCIISISR